MLKFVTKALRAKSGRKKTKAKGKKPSARAGAAERASGPAAKPAPSPDAAARALEEALDATMDAPPEVERARLHAARNKSKAALDHAAQTLDQTQANAKHPMTAERRALIHAALSVHQAKSKVLDNLDSDQREKLQAIALQVFNGSLGAKKDE